MAESRLTKLFQCEFKQKILLQNSSLQNFNKNDKERLNDNAYRINWVNEDRYI